MYWASLIVAALFGACMGSFLNVCRWRLPRNLDVLTSSSQCAACGTKLAWYDNVPIVGWLLLRGQCRYCGTPFSARYVLMELFFAALCAGVVAIALAAGDAPRGSWLGSWPAPWLNGWLSPAVACLLAGLAVLVLCYYLALSSFIDYDHTIIPDELTTGMQVIAPALAMLVGCATAAPWLPFAWWAKPTVDGILLPDPLGGLAICAGIAGTGLAVLVISLGMARWIYGTYLPAGQRWERPEDHRDFARSAWFYAISTALLLAALAVLALWAHSAMPSDSKLRGTLAAMHLGQVLLGSLAGWGILYLVGLVGTLAFRRNAMGYGDVKFLAPAGCFIGPLGVVYAIGVAAAVGTIIAVPRRLLGIGGREIPFGPFLAIGVVVSLLLGPSLHGWLFPVG